MQSIKVSDNLVIEVYPAAGPDDRPLVKIIDLARQRDDPEAGVVVVHSTEIKALVAALLDAGVELVGEQLAHAAVNAATFPSPCPSHQGRGEMWATYGCMRSMMLIQPTSAGSNIGLTKNVLSEMVCVL